VGLASSQGGEALGSELRLDLAPVAAAQRQVVDQITGALAVARVHLRDPTREPGLQFDAIFTSVPELAPAIAVAVGLGSASRRDARRMRADRKVPALQSWCSVWSVFQACREHLDAPRAAPGR
jgi:hypothetical protein